MQSATLVLYLWVWMISATISTEVPKLHFYPAPPDSRSTLIWVKTSNPTNVKYWKNQLDNLLTAYSRNNKGDNVQICHVGGPYEDKVCDFDVEISKQICKSDQSYGYAYEESAPCVFLKMSNVLNWKPQPYNSTDLPQTMPEPLKQHIRDKEKRGQNQIVFVHCEGENPADVENMGPLVYIPQQGFHQKYFPFKSVDGYLSPLVAVLFERPKYGVLMNIQCKLWARNIQHVDGQGSVHFELLID